jgi:RES domain-containing protein
VGRERQGAGRHDGPERYGALYAARSAVSAVAERVQIFRGRTLTDRFLQRHGGPVLALATIDDSRLGDVVDLDDPRELAARELRPSGVATHDRMATQRVASELFEEGVTGFDWWSTLEASWINVTLFAERAVPSLSLMGRPEPLTVRHPELIAAAEALGISIR